MRQRIGPLKLTILHNKAQQVHTINIRPERRELILRGLEAYLYLLDSMLLISCLSTFVYLLFCLAVLYCVVLYFRSKRKNVGEFLDDQTAVKRS